MLWVDRSEHTTIKYYISHFRTNRIISEISKVLVLRIKFFELILLIKLESLQGTVSRWDKKIIYPKYLNLLFKHFFDKLLQNRF